MAEPEPDISLTLPYGDLADDYARQQIDREWEQYKARQAQEAAAAAGEGAPGAIGPGTEAAGAKPKLKTGVIGAAIDATLAAAREGILTAVKPGPLNMQGAREVVMGAMQTAFAPIAGLAAGLGQGVENLAPELAASEFLPGGINGPAFTARHLAMGAPDVKTLSPDEMAALSQPMTGREAFELAVQQVPFVAPGVKKFATAVQVQKPTLMGEAGRLRLRGEVTPALAPNSATYNNLKNIGAAILHSGETSRTKFDKAMVELVGESVRPHLQTLYTDAGEALKKLQASTAEGASLPSTRELLKRFKEGEFGLDWYGNAAAELKSLFGEDGPLVGDLLAATSANTALDANVVKALKLYGEYKAGKTPDEIVAAMHPEDLHRKNVANAFARRPIEGPKVGEYALAIGGDPEAVVQDIWMQRVFKFANVKEPSEAQRAFVAAIITREAKRLGVEPRQYQAALWIAQKIIDESEKFGAVRAKELAGRSLTDVVKQKLDARTAAGLPDLRSMVTSEAGRADVQTTLLLARVMAGAVTGAATADNPEDAITRALVGAGLGAIATPARVRQIVGLMKEVGATAAKGVKTAGPEVMGQRGSIGQPPAPGASGPAPGFVRFYHGGVPGEGTRWLSPDLAYAEGYAKKSTGGVVQYVDIPETSPLLVKAFDDTGLSTKAPYNAFEAPADVMRGARPLPQAAPSAPAGGGAAPPGSQPPALPGAPPPPGGAGGGPRRPQDVGPGRINLERVNATDATKRVMLAVNRLVGEREPAKGNRATVSHAETIEAAKAWNLSKLMLLNPEELPLGQVRAVQQSARDHYVAAAAYLDDVRARRRAGDPAAEAEYWPALTVAAKLAELEQMPGTEVARTLEARKILSEESRVPAGTFTPEQLLDLTQRMEGAMGGDVNAAEARLLALDTKAKRGAYLGNVMTALRTGRDIFHEIWINSLLTNPVTHSANLTGTAMSMAWNLPEHYTAEIINRLFFRDPEGVQRGEAAAMVRAIPEGVSNGVRLAGKALRGAEAGGVDAQLLQQTRVEQGPALTSSNVGLSPDSLPGQAVDVIGSGIRIPTKMLGVEDAFWKGVSYTTELSALALREGRAEGLTGPALERRVSEILAHPGAKMLQDAVDVSMLRTLNAELGPTGQAFMRWANSLPGGRVIMPFVRTPTNIAKWMGQRAPVLAQLSAQNWRDIQAGGALRDKALARQALGAGLSALIAYEVAQGNITGDGDPDRRIKSLEREERPRNSIKVGNTYYEYSRLDPVGGLIGAIANYTELTRRIPTQDDLDEWAAYGEALALAVGNTMVNKTYLRGLADVLDAIKEPDRGSATVARGFARSLVPAGLRATTRALDDQVVRDARSLVDAVKSGIPGLAEGVPPVRNPITGEPFRYPVGWGASMLNPIFMTEKKGDPVIEEVIANRIGLSPVPWYVGPGERTDSPLMTEPRGGGPALKLTPAQHDYWIVAMTQLARDGRGRTLHEALTDLVQSSTYADQSKGPGGGREMMIKAIYSAFRDQGEMMLRKESPTLEGKVRQNMERQLERKLPVTDPRSRPPETTPQGAGALIRSLGR